MVTMETALAAIITFVLGAAAGAWFTVTAIIASLRTEQGRKIYRDLIEKAERHELEHHEAR